MMDSEHLDSKGVIYCTIQNAFDFDTHNGWVCRLAREKEGVKALILEQSCREGTVSDRVAAFLHRILKAKCTDFERTARSASKD